MPHPNKAPAGFNTVDNHAHTANSVVALWELKLKLAAKEAKKKRHLYSTTDAMRHFFYELISARLRIVLNIP